MLSSMMAPESGVQTLKMDPACGDSELAFRAWLGNSPSPHEKRSCDVLKIKPEERFIRLPFPERRALSTDSAQAGGYTVQEKFIAGYSFAMRQSFPWGSLATRIPIELVYGEVGWPWIDETTEGTVLSNDEGAVSMSVSDASFGTLNLFPKMFHSKPVVASRRWVAAVQASGQIIGKMIGNRMGKAMNRYFTLGVGVSSPVGFIHAAQTFAAGAATSLDRDDVENLYWSVGTEYRDAPGAAYQCHSTIAKYLSKLNISGEPLNLVAVERGQLRLLGRPLIINDLMSSTMASGNKTLAYGDWSNYIIAETPLEMQKLVEYYTATHAAQTTVQNSLGFIGRIWGDGALSDPNDIGTLKMLLH